MIRSFFTRSLKNAAHGTLRALLMAAVLLIPGIAGCKSQATAKSTPSGDTGPTIVVAAQSPAGDQPADDAPPADTTDGFDGHRALQQVAKQVAFGPRPAGSPAIQQLQAYLKSQLASYGCKFDVDDFQVDTPVGHRSMENILVKIPGDKPGIILLGTHYDTKILPNFVGADDAGSSTAVMLEIARNLCPTHGRYNVWIAFFDGEEAARLQWSDEDSVYGSREMAARLSNSGDLPKVKAFLLADLVGGKKLHFKRDGASTSALVDQVWRVANKLGYANIFLNETTDIGGDDHFPFIKRKVPSVDVIDLDAANDVPYWHDQHGTDSLDKISAKSLAITGHVFLESVKELQSK
jgi:glutaminyl-peptide cyclotransferase